MDLLKEIWAWSAANYSGILVSLSILIMGLEGIVRLTPTKKDDSALERIGKAVHWLMDLLKIPNVKREDGKIVAGTHEKRKS